MEIPPGLIVGGVVLLVLLFGGALAAMIINWGPGKSKEQPEPENAENQPQPQRGPAAPVREAAELAVAPANEVPPHPDEIMRVVYDEQGGRLLVEVEGERYAHIREIRDADVGKRVLWAIVDLIRFTGGMAANPQAVRSAIGAQPPPAVSPARQPVAPSPAVDARAPAPREPTQPAVRAPTPAPPTPPPTAGRVSPTPTPETQSDRQRYSLFGYFRKGFEAQPSSSTPAPSAGSFIDEIEGILQERIQELATPLPYAVHVLTGPDGSLQIEVGLDRYGSPDEVPDPEIRQLIKDAVAEWERR